MGELPLRDRFDNALVGFRFTSSCEAERDDVVSAPLSLIVVALAGTVLMMFDARRRQWELPGGMRELGESARQTAVRELAEETGIRTNDLDLAAVAEFELARPARREYAAVYRTELQVAPHLVVNDEALRFQWWDPRTPSSDDMSPLDAEIGKRVMQAR
jgi:8-oxo-dGTP pyrophosphatase MutT (NUDIX family)